MSPDTKSPSRVGMAATVILEHWGVASLDDGTYQCECGIIHRDPQAHIAQMLAAAELLGIERDIRTANGYAPLVGPQEERYCTPWKQVTS